jgi:HEAT repeat protein
MRKTTLALLAGLAVLSACRSKPSGSNVGGLIADLKSPDRDVSGKANLTLIQLGESSVPDLVQMLKDPDPGYRATAARTLWGLGSRGKAAVPALGEALADDDTSVRMTAAMALEGMGPDSSPAVPALARALKDKNATVRQWAAKALGRVGRAAESAVPALVQAAKSEGTRPAAEEAIRRIRGGQ